MVRWELVAAMLSPALTAVPREDTTDGRSEPGGEIGGRGGGEGLGEMRLDEGRGGEEELEEVRLDDVAVGGGEVVGGGVGVGVGLGPPAAEQVLELDGGGEAGLEVVAWRGREGEDRQREARGRGGGVDALLGAAAHGGVG
jgi:hypothetical protein